MTPNNIRILLHQLESLADGWSEEIPSIERDLALEKLRSLYDALRMSEPIPQIHEETSDPVSINLDDVLSVDMDAQEPAFDDMQAESDVPVSEPELPEDFTAEAYPVPESDLHEPEESESDPEMQESVSDSVSIPEPAIEPEIEVVQPKVAVRPEPAIPTLFGMDDSEELMRHRHKKQVLMSLYDLEEEPVVKSTPQPKSEPVFQTEPLPDAVRAAEKPTELLTALEEEDELMMEEIDLDAEEAEEIRLEPGSVLGEVMNHDVQTLGESLAVGRTISDEGYSTPAGLRSVIGLNDRFLMIRDLFDGDAAAFDRAIGTIDGFDDFDDCMIYIAENYAWNPNSDGAKLLMGLIERKLS